jgi:hypothetical protein
VTLPKQYAIGKAAMRLPMQRLRLPACYIASGAIIIRNGEGYEHIGNLHCIFAGDDTELWHHRDGPTA